LGHQGDVSEPNDVIISSACDEAMVTSDPFLWQRSISLSISSNRLKKMWF
jgi:hypothetical protein